MNRAQLNFNLPNHLIAQEPAQPRDHCRLMVLNRDKQSIKHDRFFNLGDYLKPGDVLVFNQSKVMPARLIGQRGDAKREVLLLKDLAKGEWEVMVGGKVVAGDTIDFSDGLSCEVIEKIDTVYLVRFNQQGPEFLQTIDKIGQAPTPPYIKKILEDKSLYQTIYAKERGSAAAPTAGLHFTQDLLDKLSAQGIQQEFVTLHVGLGTFQPIKADMVEDHKIHTEWFSLDRAVYDRLKQAKEEGRRIIAIGTTSVRVLETIFNPTFNIPPSTFQISHEADLFIYPGYKFQAVDALITNFHTPYSSLLALVYAFTGQDFIKQAYQQAVDKEYRFFSFGDAMLIQ